jgi:hypothetical protein
MLLIQLSPDWKPDLGAAGFENGQFRTQENAERLIGKDALAKLQEIGGGIQSGGLYQGLQGGTVFC